MAACQYQAMLPHLIAAEKLRAQWWLLPGNFLDLANFFLSLPTDIFDDSFGFQITILDYSSDSLFDFAFYLVHLAFYVVSCA
jgi:hypothetical protein